MSTSSTDDRLIHMANQIADFFAAQGEARAVPGIADHIRKFWTPPMRASLVRLAEQDDSLLRPLLRQAVKLIAGSVPPQ